MIKSVRMINFKNISDSTIEFKSNISGIYGANGSGKTTVVEAIRLLKYFFGVGEIYSDFIIKNDSLSDVIKKGSSICEISMEISLNNFIFRVGVIFEKVSSNEIIVVKEYLEYKEDKPRQKYKNLFTVKNDSNDFLPKIYLEKNKKDQFKYIQENIFEKNNINFQSLIKKMGDFKSFFFTLGTEYYKLENKKSEDKLENIMTYWSILVPIFNKVGVITLKDQAISNMSMFIPIYCENTCIHLGKEKNICEEDKYKEIEKAIEDISELFSVLIHNGKIICNGELKLENEEGKKYAVNIYVEKKGTRVNIFNESSGTIKLVSILSSLTQVLKNENATLVIDELDVHIFEYLLAFILSKLSTHIKGQLIFTSHNLLPMEKLDRNSIILATIEDNENIIYTYFKGKISQTTNLRLKYLRSQYTWTEENITPLIINESKVEKILREMGRN